MVLDRHVASVGKNDHPARPVELEAEAAGSRDVVVPAKPLVVRARLQEHALDDGELVEIRAYLADGLYLLLGQPLVGSGGDRSCRRVLLGALGNGAGRAETQP